MTTAEQLEADAIALDGIAKRLMLLQPQANRVLRELSASTGVLLCVTMESVAWMRTVSILLRVMATDAKIDALHAKNPKGPSQ